MRGEVIPLVVSEFYPVRAGGPYTGFSAEEVARRVAWYDAEASKDYYHWAFCPFTIAIPRLGGLQLRVRYPRFWNI